MLILLLSPQRTETNSPQNNSVIITISHHYFSVAELKKYRSSVARTARIVHLVTLEILILRYYE